MLATTHRLHRSADFAAVVRSGARKGRRTLVAHARIDDSPVRVGGPRIGFVVSKAVGDAVTRHRVSRRLRHIAAGLVPELDEDVQLVVRATPASAAAGHDDLERDFRSAATRAVERAREAAA